MYMPNSFKFLDFVVEMRKINYSPYYNGRYLHLANLFLQLSD